MTLRAFRCAPPFSYVRAALLSPSMASREPGVVGELMFRRFQKLITPMAKVSSDISFSDKCSRTCS